MSALPGINDWNVYAGGTSAAPGKRAYDIRRNGILWSIQPTSNSRGQHRGYSLTAFGLEPYIYSTQKYSHQQTGYKWIRPDGFVQMTPTDNLHRSPASAVKVAQYVHEDHVGTKYRLVYLNPKTVQGREAYMGFKFGKGWYFSYGQAAVNTKYHKTKEGAMKDMREYADLQKRFTRRKK